MNQQMRVKIPALRVQTHVWQGIYCLQVDMLTTVPRLHTIEDKLIIDRHYQTHSHYTLSETCDFYVTGCQK